MENSTYSLRDRGRLWVPVSYSNESNTTLRNVIKVVLVLIFLAAFIPPVLAVDINFVLKNNNTGDITGKVTDDQKAGLPGVSVVLKGTQLGTVTDQAGQFRLTMPVAENNRGVLVFSYVGYVPQEVEIGNRNLIDVHLIPDPKQLNEVVVVGYGTQKKASLTSAVSTIDSKLLESRPVPSVLNALQGQVPGLNITQSSAQPGFSKTSINIRGTSTLSNNPVLLVVDGVPSTLTLDMFNPNDIDNISILKDASATSIYGARASGGVLLLTTKTGTNKGKPDISYDGNFGLQKNTRLPVFVEAPQYVDLVNLALANDNPNSVPRFDAATVQKYKSGQLPSTNWIKQILSERAFQQQHNLSVRGSGEKVNYFLSGSLMDQGGLMPNVGYKRNNLRSNITVHLTDKLNLGLTSAYINEKRIQPAYAGLGAALGWAYVVPVTEYPYTKAGNARTFRGGLQPFSPLLDGGLETTIDNTFTNTISAEYKLLPGLNLKGIYSIGFGTSFLTNFQKTQTAYWDDETIAIVFPNPASLTKTNVDFKNPNLILTATYDKTFGKHNFKVLGGYSQESQKINFNSLTRSEFLTNELTEIDAGSNNKNLWSMSGRAVEWAIASGFGRVNYDYDGKYLLEVNGRVDGSSRFLNKKVGFFPSISAGWVLSGEQFLQNSKLISFLKIRASYGAVGNQSALAAGGSLASQSSGSLALYPFAPLLGTGSYILNNSQFQTTFYSNIANPDLTWETKKTTNIGIDASFFKSHLSMTLDVFNEMTTGIIRAPTVPGTFGANAPYVNSGKFRNRGYEITLSYKNQIGDLRYHVGANFFDSRNKVISLGGTAQTIGENPLREGHSRWEWFGYQADGIFQSQSEIDSHAPQFNQARLKPGDIKLKDVNGDGVVNADDRITLGEAQSHYAYGFNGGLAYRRFDLSFLLQGVFQNITRFGSGIQTPFASSSGNILTSQLDFWTPQNPDARYPLLRIDQSVNNTLSSWWLFNGAYLRFKNIQIGYTLPGALSNKIKIKNARIFFTGENLFTLTAKNFPKVIDPELGNNTGSGNYPQIKVFSLGVHIGI